MRLIKTPVNFFYIDVNQLLQKAGFAKECTGMLSNDDALGLRYSASIDFDNWSVKLNRRYIGLEPYSNAHLSVSVIIHKK